MPEPLAAADLIDRAFALARRSGKSDWWAMTIPVLKNRLLLLTKNTFREADFGATSFRDFLSKTADIVKVVYSPPPGFVILKSAAPEHAEEPTTTAFRGERVRADLWRAILDYTSGLRYIWDDSQQTARPARADEKGLELPTASQSDVDDWRAKFIASQKLPNAEVAKLLEEWREKRLPTGALPAAMRPAWNKHLKREVEHRLKSWFESTLIEAPPIIEERHESGASEKEMQALRDFLVGCVRMMSKQELLELRISPATAMRALRPNNTSGEK